MGIHIEERDQTLTVVIQGRIDTLTVPDITTDALAYMDGRYACVVLDVMGVDYVSSSGLRFFVMAQKAASHAGITLQIKGIQPFLQQLFQVTGLKSLFQFIP